MFERTLVEPVLRGFYQQLEKEAAPVSAIMRHLVNKNTLHGLQAGLGSGLGLGAAGGAAVGALHGGYKNYRTAREQGATAGQAAGAAVGGGLGGMVSGATKGALLGAGTGALAGTLKPRLLSDTARSLAERKGRVGGVARFGQRQVHSVTGWMPSTAPGSVVHPVESIGAGAAGPRKELQSVMEKAYLGRGNLKHLDNAQSALAATEKAQNMGLTSLPGIAKSIKNNGLGATTSAGLAAGWKGTGPGMKSLMVGLPAMEVAHAFRKHDPNDPDKRGTGEAIGSTLGSTLGMMAAPLSLTGGALLSGGLQRAGGAMGKGVDRLTGRRKPQGQPPLPPRVPFEPARPPASEPGDTGQVAMEHVYGTGYGGGAGGLES